MNKWMVVFAMLLMAGGGVFAQEGKDIQVPSAQVGVPRGGKLPRPAAPRPGMEAGVAERGAMAMNVGRNQLEGMSMFLEADVNKDGIIDEAEAKAAETKFLALFHQRVKDHNAQMIRRFDKNGDGILDDQEKAVMKETMDKFSTTLHAKSENFNEVFRRFDKNGDGQVSAEELQGVMEEIQKQALPVLFKEFDKNGDGKLEGEELAAARTAMLKKYDRNNDGQLDLPELRPLWREVSDRNKALRTEQARKTMEDQKKKRFDLNGDGVLDEQEKARAAEEMRKPGAKGLMAPPQPE